MPSKPIHREPVRLDRATSVASLFASWYEASSRGDYERAAQYRVALLRDHGVMVNFSRTSRSDRRP